MPAPYKGRNFTFKQPDDTSLWLQGWGNQHHAVFQTLSGYTVTKNPETGFYVYANVTPDQEELVPTSLQPRVDDPTKLGLTKGLRISRDAARAKARTTPSLPTGNSRWETRRKEARLALQSNWALDKAMPAPPKRTTVGDYVGLCILIDFPDLHGSIKSSEVEAFCNKKNYSGFGNNGSVFDYFYDMSRGKLRYTNAVTPYYRAKYPRSYYMNPKVEYTQRTRELIKEALDDLKAKGFDFSILTTDNRGYAYAVNVFYAGDVDNNWGEGLWPHAHHLLTGYDLGNGATAMDYQITDIGSELSLGTFCHENGHMVCDFPDLYDYGDDSGGIGAYCLMCSGANRDKKNPTHVNAYLKYRAGWAASVNKVTNGVTAKLNVENQFYIHRKNATEYFIIENRQQVGRDILLPSHGLAIWHIDELGNNEHQQMTMSEHYECSLKQADGRNDLENDENQIGDDTDLFHASINANFGNTSVPSSRWWDGTPSGLNIRNISQSAAHMSFDASVDGGAVPAPQIGGQSLPDDEDERAIFITTLVKSAIKSFSPTKLVVRATLLGPNGLGHGTEFRKQYYDPIRTRLAQHGASMVTLTPLSFADTALITVGDVCDLVLEDLA